MYLQKENNKINLNSNILQGIVIFVCIHTDHEILGMVQLSVLAAGEVLSGVTEEISWSGK